MAKTKCDMIGCPITVGATVLVAGSHSPTINTIVKVEKVNNKSVLVTLPTHWWDYKTRKFIYESKQIRRKTSQVIVIDAQLAYIQEHYPENLL